MRQRSVRAFLVLLAVLAPAAALAQAGPQGRYDVRDVMIPAREVFRGRYRESYERPASMAPGVGFRPSTIRGYRG